MLFNDIWLAYTEPQHLVRLFEKLKTLNNVLVVGHCNITPEILSLMGQEDMIIKENDYGVIYMLQKHHSQLIMQSVNIPIILF